MKPSAPNSIIAFVLGSSLVRATLFKDGQIYSVASPRTLGDPTYSLALATKEIEDQVGRRIEPDKVVIAGREKDLAELGEIKIKKISEEEAISSAEKWLSTRLGQPVALLDLGSSAFLDHYPAEEIGRYLPFSSNLADIENYLANKRLYPRVLPVSLKEYEIDLAVARAAITKLGEKEGRKYVSIDGGVALVLTGGLLTGVPKVADLAAVLLDSFYFKGGVAVYVDEREELTGLGAVLAATGEDLALAEDFPKLRRVGSFLHLGGAGRATVDFGYEEKQRLSMEEGEVINLPITAEHAVKVTVGAGKGAHQFDLVGGAGGIYLDHRARPLPLSPGSKESISRVLAWRKALDSEPLLKEEQ